jgi:hypothetical protein
MFQLRNFYLLQFDRIIRREINVVRVFNNSSDLCILTKV